MIDEADRKLCDLYAGENESRKKRKDPPESIEDDSAR